MNTKEAIECLSNEFLGEIIDVLKRGEKFEDMWEEFIYGLAHINIGNYQNPCEEKKTDLECVNKIVDDIKQKYFPKPVKDKDYFYEATSKDPHLRKVYMNKKGGSQ